MSAPSQGKPICLDHLFFFNLFIRWKNEALFQASSAEGCETLFLGAQNPGCLCSQESEETCENTALEWGDLGGSCGRAAGIGGHRRGPGSPLWLSFLLF